MSLTNIRPFFRTRLKGLGFTEHTDGFNIANVPNVSFDKGFHIETGTTSPNDPITHRVLDVGTSTTLQVFFKGFRDPAQAIDVSISEGQAILCDILESSVRLESSGIKNINFESMTPTAFADSNDNDVLLIMEFTVRNIMTI